MKNQQNTTSTRTSSLTVSPKSGVRQLALAGSLIAFALLAFPAQADGVSSVSPNGRSFGLGLELGAPTSINAKFMLTSNTGIVVGIGAGVWYDAALSLHADYLWHPLVAHFDNGTFSAYIGGGAWASLGLAGPHYGYYRPYTYEGPVGIGGRLPLGLAVAFNEFPIEAFVEVVPAIEVFPGFGVFGQGGLGARFYF